MAKLAIILFLVMFGVKAVYFYKYENFGSKSAVEEAYDSKSQTKSKTT